MNFRLLDDGSATPSPYRDAVSEFDAAEVAFDLDGNLRGRTQNVGTQTLATRSPGAYETLQADLFWIGVDANGDEVSAPSWESASGWATNRFANVSNAPAPPSSGQTAYLGAAFEALLASAPTNAGIGVDWPRFYYPSEVAGISTFSATATGPSSVRLDWTAADATRPVVMERKDGAVWTLIATDATGTTFAAPATLGAGETSFRIWDGETFHVAGSLVPNPHIWLVYDDEVAAAQAVSAWTIVAQEIRAMSEYFNAGETPVFLARVADSATETPRTSADVDAISMTVYREDWVFGRYKLTPLDGWENVSVPVSALLDSLVTDDDKRWTKDGIGFNFRFEPDARTLALFAAPGEYRVVFTIRPKIGNPAPLVFKVKVN